MKPRQVFPIVWKAWHPCSPLFSLSGDQIEFSITLAEIPQSAAKEWLLERGLRLGLPCHTLKLSSLLHAGSPSSHTLATGKALFLALSLPGTHACTGSSGWTAHEPLGHRHLGEESPTKAYLCFLLFFLL